MLSTALTVVAFLAIQLPSAPGISATKDLRRFEYFTHTNLSPFHENDGLELIGSVVTSHLRALRRGGDESVSKKRKKRKDDDDDNDDDGGENDDKSSTEGHKTHTYSDQEVEPNNEQEEEPVKEAKASKEKNSTDAIVDHTVVSNPEEEDVNPEKETKNEPSIAAKASKNKTQTKKSKEPPDDSTVSDAGGVSTSDFLIYGILGVLVFLGIIVAVIYSRSHDRRDYTPIG